MTDANPSVPVETKPWYQSRGVVAGIVTVAAVIASAVFHTQIAAADQTELINDGLAIGTVLASGVALYGRIFATKKVTLTKGP